MYFYDENGFLCKISEKSTEIAPPEGLNRPFFIGSEWIESLIPCAWQIDSDGYFVVDMVNHDPRGDDTRYTVIPCPSGQFRRPRFINGEWVDANPVTDLEFLDSAKIAKRQEIIAAHAAAMAAGAPFMIDGDEDIVQRRNSDDDAIFIKLVMRATREQAKGIEDPVILFRAESNTAYMLTPAQMIALSDEVDAHGQALYVKMWSLKDAIDAAETREEVESINW